LLRAEDKASKPFGLILHQHFDEFIQPCLVETLRRDPHPSLRMVAMHQFRLLFQQVHQGLRGRVARIAAGDEQVVNPG